MPIYPEVDFCAERAAESDVCKACPQVSAGNKLATSTVRFKLKMYIGDDGWWIPNPLRVPPNHVRLIRCLLACVDQRIYCSADRIDNQAKRHILILMLCYNAVSM